MIKKYLRKNIRVYNLLWIINTIIKSNWKKVTGAKKKYPKVIQLPITSKCNAKCVMCNVWKINPKDEMTPEQLGRYLKDDIFKEVLSVGINGGEPSLLPDLEKYIEKVLELPKINSLNIISHGFSTNILLKHLENIYKLCKDKNVSFHVSVSLDGIGKIHNMVRGKSNVFEKTLKSIMEVKNNKFKYCDSYDVGCTVIEQNAQYLVELDTFASLNDIDINYRLGIENKRIANIDLVDSFFIKNHNIQTAKEFFYAQFLKSKIISDKFVYFSIFYFINNNFKGRLKGCTWQENGITLDSKGKIYYCAVESDEIGDLNYESGEKAFFSDKNINYRQEIVKNKCDSCIHYTDKPELSKFLIFLKYIIMKKIYFRLYKLKSLVRFN